MPPAPGIHQCVQGCGGRPPLSYYGVARAWNDAWHNSPLHHIGGVRAFAPASLSKGEGVAVFLQKNRLSIMPPKTLLYFLC